MTIVTFTQIINKSQSLDVNEREEAARLLSNFASNEKAETILLSLLKDENWRVRKSAIETVLHIKSPSLLQGVVKLLYDDDNVGARNAAMDVLMHIGQEALPFIKKEFNTKHPDVKLFLATIVGELRDKDTLPFLYKCLEDENENVVAAAIVSLGKIGMIESIPYLLEFLKSSNPWYQYQSIEALGLIGHPSVIDNIKSLQSNIFLRPAIIQALSQIDNEDSVKTLAEFFNREPSIGLINALISLIFQYRPSALWNSMKLNYKNLLQDIINKDAVKRLLNNLPNESPETQFSILSFLAFLNLPEVLDFIKPFLQSPDTMYKALEIIKLYSVNEIFSLANFVEEIDDDVLTFEYITLFANSTQREHADYLAKFLSHSNPQIKLEAYRIIHHILKEESYYYLLDALNDENDKVNEFAAKQIIEMAKNNPSMKEKIEEDILKLVDLPSQNLKSLTIYILYFLEPQKYIHKVYEGLKSASSLIRYRALQCIVNEAPTEAFTFIKNALTDEDQKIRELAVNLLGKVPSEEAIKLLITALDDEDMWVRIEAIKSLSVRPNINVFDILKQRYNYMPTPIKIEILKYMGKLDIEASREFLSSQLSNEDEEIRSTAVQNLSPSDKKSIEILINTAKLDKNWLIRKEALKSLANANIKNFENLVFDIAKSETDLYVKKTILDILKTIKVKEVPEYIFNWVYDNQLLENFIELMAQRNDIVSYLDRLPYRIRSKIEKTLDLLSK